MMLALLPSRVLCATCNSKAVPGSVPSGGLLVHGGERKLALRQSEYFLNFIPLSSYFQSIEPPSGASISRILPEALLPFV
jgi:hypothetical protein